MNDVLEKQKREVERSKKLIKAVDKTGEQFKEELKHVVSAEKHVEAAEKERTKTDIMARSTEKKMAVTEKEVGETHEKIARKPEPGKGKGNAGSADQGR